jgi:putative solute:sodium symporter small subunit
MDRGARDAYWKKNLTYLVILLGIWFAVSYGCGILLVDQLDQIRIGGFKLGFWFAQQGSIYTFVVLIFVYVALMNRLDRRFDVDERTHARSGAPDPTEREVRPSPPPGEGDRG